MVPDYLVDQNESYIKSRGFTFRDFSPDQVIGELHEKAMRIKLHGIEREDQLSKGFSTISDNVPCCLIVGAVKP